MLGEEDVRRAVESAHDVEAIGDVKALTPHAQEQELLLFSLAELADAREGFMSAAAHNAEELRETDVIRVEILGKRDALYAHYGRAQHIASGLLVDADPDAPMSDAERERRERLISSVFTLNRASFRDGAADRLHSQLSALLLACEQNPELGALKLTRVIKPHIVKLGALLTDHQREQREDRQATASLNAARDVLDTAHRAHALAVESVLVRGGKRADLGRYLLARDASYLARRAAKKPINEEPGAPDVLDVLTPRPIAEPT
jgi:hypothetical protein